MGKEGKEEVDVEEEMGGRKVKGGKDGPGPVIVSDILCPAIHILGT